ncbi:MAG: hypothetical protein GVY19_11985 [Bacteroidetes bacterium]|jgi:hypothetical protein|nr:hypothetical protein [Bacteroidota bacterium]
MVNKQISSGDYFRSLEIIYIAFIASQGVFGVISIVLVAGGLFEHRFNRLWDIFIFLIPAVVIVGIIINKVMYQQRVHSIKEKPGLMSKMYALRAAKVVRWSVMEASSLTAIGAYLLTGYWLFIVLSAIVVLVFLSIKPTIERLANELELNAEDKKKLYDANAVVAEIDGSVR